MDLINEYLKAIGIDYNLEFKNKEYEEKLNKLLTEAPPPQKKCYVIFGSKCKDKKTFIYSILKYIVKNIGKSAQIIYGFQPDVVESFLDIYSVAFIDIDFLQTDKDKTAWRNAVLSRMRNNKVSILEIESVALMQSILGTNFMDTIANDSVVILLPDQKDRPVTI